MKEKEQITDAAVLFTVWLPEHKSYNTIMLTARRHCDCFETASKMFPLRFYFEDCVQGFWTSECRFLDRYAAKKLAMENGQLAEDTNMAELFSEDLW